MRDRARLDRYAWLSIAAAVLTIALKGAAWWTTDSVGLLGDAMESLVNLSAAVFTLVALTVAARPADEEHAYGHSKAEYLASGFEGALIFMAALAIGWAAVERLLEPRDVEDVGVGVAIAAVAALVNGGTAWVLLKAGRRHDSIALEADARHLFADVWTTGAVIAGVITVAWTGWNWLDPVIALAVAVHILYWGLALLRRSALGVLDTALPPETLAAIESTLDAYREQGMEFHALRTRKAGARRFVSFHVLVPGEWTVDRGHDLLEEIEAEIRDTVENVTVFTHLEPLEDPVSWHDVRLDRSAGERSGK
ncbi:MAG: cation diffusion facilitator family transporter [Gemmatimonadota bacterium]|nr:cation diffusion facilitator family transporter [Gemmatimonadota bacterium]